jgi:hypothetical protein
MTWMVFLLLILLGLLAGVAFGWGLREWVRNQAMLERREPSPHGRSHDADAA